MFGEQIADALQKSQAGRILPLRIGVRKMRADVAEPRGAQQRVADRMRERVAVGMAHGPFVEMGVRCRRGSACGLRRGDAGRIRFPRGSSPRALLAKVEFRKFHVAGASDLQVALGSRPRRERRGPMRSTRPASSDAVTPSWRARANASSSREARNTCGVCARTTRSRGIVAVMSATSVVRPAGSRVSLPSRCPWPECPGWPRRRRPLPRSRVRFG